MHKLLNRTLTAALGLLVAGSAIALPRLTRLGQSSPAPELSELQAQPRTGVKDIEQVLTVKKPVISNLTKARRGTVAGKKPKTDIRLSADAAGRSVFGYMVMANSWTETNTHYGVYNMSLGVPATLTQVAAGDNVTSTAWYADGKYYCYRLVDFYGIALGTTVDTYDAYTWQHVSHEIPDLKYLLPSDPKQNPADGKIYTSAKTSSGLAWGTIDQYTYEFSKIADVDWFLAGLIIKDGTGYGVTPGGTLLKVNLTTGSTSTVGSTGLNCKYLTSAYYDEAGDLMYFINTNDVESALYTINLTTAAAAKVYDFADSEEIVGLFAPRAVSEAAPSAPSAVSINLDGESLNYIVSITAPTTTIGGESLSADGLTYRMYVAGNEYAGAISPGATVEVACSAAVAGYVSARAVLVNAYGESDGAGCKAYVGSDVINNLSKVKLTDDNAGKFTLTWQPVKAAHGGYIDYSQLMYTVLYLDGSVVADSLTETTLEIPYEEIEQPTLYQYLVQATYKGVPYPEVESNTILKGATEPPFTCRFDEEGDMAQFTILDANNDRKAWRFDTKGDGCARMTYHDTNTMDDWMVLPGMKLTAGKQYKFSMDAFCGGPKYPERFEVKMGRQCSPEAMTETIIEPTVVNTTDAQTHTATVMVDEDGVYFIGIHGISDPDRYFLYVDNVSLSTPIDGTVPGPATDLVATPDINGGEVATISFKAPITNVAGQPVGQLTSAVVSRADGTVAAVVEAPIAGQTYSVTDNAPMPGASVYTVVVNNAAGASEPASVSVFVGYTYPAAVTEVSAVETADGYVTLTWNAVDRDANGLQLGQGAVSYSVYIFDGEERYPIAHDVETNTYSYRALPPGQQAFMQWAVFPVSIVGEGGGVTSNLIAVGSPYVPPMRESFANQQLNYNWMLGTPDPDHVMEVALATDKSVPGIHSQDNDNGYFMLQGYSVGDAASLVSGKIAIPEGEHTVLSFHTFGFTAANGNDITARVYCEGSETVLGTAKPLADKDWVCMSYDMDAFAGKTVMVEILCTVSAYKMAMFDNIFVGTPRNNDLAATGISAPEKVNAGLDVEVLVSVENRGAASVAGFTVDFYVNNQLFVSEQGIELAPNAKTEVMCTISTTPLTADQLNISAVVNYEEDEDLDNNATNTVTTKVVKADVPVPAGLTASVVDNSVTLKWDACSDIQGEPQTVTEDFESGTPWDKYFGDWTMVDRDGSPVGGFNEAGIPGFTPATTCASFFVWDTSDDLGWVWAHSGNRLLAALFRYDNEAVDDWAISPELSGNAQTISFWAMSYDPEYPETIEVYYTTTESVNPDDYIKVQGFGTQTLQEWDWTEYSFDVPAGATHFAIRSCASENFLLLLDDVTFERAGNSVSVKGYNVYCNGQKINNAMVSVPEYTHNLEAEGELVYNVTALYDKGESRPSNDARVMFNGIDNVSVAPAVMVQNDEIIVTGANGVDVTLFAADGSKVAQRTNVDTARFKVVSGVYVLTIGQRKLKVAVK